MSLYQCISDDVKLGYNVILSKFINLYGCTIGDDTKIGAFVEIQKNAIIGNRCKISSHSFVCEGVTIGDNCFIGHGVIFINDKYPRAVNEIGNLAEEEDWKNRFVRTIVCNNVSIGSNSTVLGNVVIGENSIIGAGSVITRNIPPNTICVGNPARIIKVLEKVES